MTDSLRKLFAEKMHRGKGDTISVLVSLKNSPDDSCLASLQKTGLKVKAVEGNKLAGQIVQQRLSELKNHIDVNEVELSVKLKPTSNRVHNN